MYSKYKYRNDNEQYLPLSPNAVMELLDKASTWKMTITPIPCCTIETRKTIHLLYGTNRICFRM